MKKALAVLGVAVLALVATGGTATAAPKFDPAKNKPAYWEAQLGEGAECVKYEMTGGVKEFTPEGPFALLVLKAGTVHDEVWGGEGTYAHSTGKDLSHVIVCSGPQDEEPGDGGEDDGGDDGGVVIPF